VCIVSEDTATHCNTLQHTEMGGIRQHIVCSSRNQTLHHTASHCNALQHTATHCNKLQRTTAEHCSTLQHTPTLTEKGGKKTIRFVLSVAGEITPKPVRRNVSTEKKKKNAATEICSTCWSNMSLEKREQKARQATLTHCHQMQHAETHYNTLQRALKHCTEPQ